MASVKVTDELGLVLPNRIIAVYIPAVNQVLPLRIVRRRVHVIPYGPLPLSKGETLPTLDGGSVTVPEDGVFPARAYTSRPRRFPTTLDVDDKTDIFYIDDTRHPEWIVHAHVYIEPSHIRVMLRIPETLVQGVFHPNRVPLDIRSDFGWNRGYVEVVYFPGVHYGFDFCNDLYVDFRTWVTIIYGEYMVEPVLDIDKVLEIMFGKAEDTYYYTLPVESLDSAFKEKLQKLYGFYGDYVGYPVYPEFMKEEAKKKVEEIVNEIKKQIRK